MNSNRHKEIQTKTITLKAKSLLPSEVTDILKSLTYDERISYCRVLHEEGWTYQSMATPLGLTRERVRQMIDTKYQTKGGHSYTPVNVSHLPVPKLPVKVIVKEVVKMKILPDDQLKILKDLKDKAFWVRGTGKNNRAEAEEYVALLYDLTQQGYSVYGLAKQIGVTHLAIYSRLVRYGYRPIPNSSHRVYRILTHRPAPANK